MRLSIITPTLNRNALLREAVESVRAQNWPAVEHIIVDGGSTDGTLAWLETQSDLTVIHGPDRGVYDAMNKGLAHATGEAIGFLNSDDTYEPGAFTLLSAALVDNPQAACAAGSALLVEEDAVVERFEQPEHSAPDGATSLLETCLPNPRLFRKAVFDRIGGFSEHYALVADRDLLVRLDESAVQTVSIPQIVYRYRRHDGSLTFDAGLRHQMRLRHELLALAQAWRNTKTASQSVRAAARVLEGRQRLKLALHALRKGHLKQAIEFLIQDKGLLSLHPTASVAAALAHAVQTSAIKRRSKPLP